MKKLAVLFVSCVLLFAFSGCNKPMEQKQEQSSAAGSEQNSSVSSDQMAFSNYSHKEPPKVIKASDFSQVLSARFMAAGYTLTDFWEIPAGYRATLTTSDETPKYLFIYSERYDSLDGTALLGLVSPISSELEECIKLMIHEVAPSVDADSIYQKLIDEFAFVKQDYPVGTKLDAADLCSEVVEGGYYFRYNGFSISVNLHEFAPMPITILQEKG